MTVVMWGALTGGLLFLAGGPMWAGWVRPGPLWGVRTSLAFESEENWYRLNRPAGRVLVGWAMAHGVVASVMAAVIGLDTVLPEDAPVGLLLLIPTNAMVVHLFKRIQTDSKQLRQERREARVKMHK